MASWKSIEPFVVPQGITEVSDTKKMPLGTIVRAQHEDYGAGEFIYLPGVASVAAGSWVLYNTDTWTTKLLAGNDIGPVAVAMAAIDSTSEYGFFQIGGEATAKSADVADSGKVYIDSVPGQCDDAVVVGDRVTGAKWTSADDTASGTATAMLHRPFVTDQKDAT